MDFVIEDITRKSEAELRKKNMTKMLADSYDQKVKRSNANVNEFVDILGLDNVVVSTSGGKDSAALSKLCKDLYPNIKHIMFNTGLEYKATVDLAKSQGAEIIPPKKSWVKSCEEHGYPIVSKNVSRRLRDIGNTPIGTVISLFNKIYGLSDKWLHLTDKEILPFKVSKYCCEEFKKKPSKQLKLNPILGTRIQESNARKSAWKKTGCNSYNKDYTKGICKPLSLWTDQDVEKYIDENDVELSVLYTQYEQKRTGCCNCPYGAQIDGSRFDLLKKLEPKRYDYFINKTKLGYILMISDVDIVSDPGYMEEKTRIWNDIKKWHEQHSNNKYLDYRCSLALECFDKEKIIDALNHIYQKGAKLKFDINDIIDKLNELDKKRGKK